MIKLHDWDKSLRYAKELCEKQPYDIRPSQYTLHNGNKGIYLTIYDSEYMPFYQAASGVYDTYEGMKGGIDIAMAQLLEEVM